MFATRFVLRSSMDMDTGSPSRHMTQCCFIFKPARRTTITCLCTTNNTPTLDCLRGVVSFPLLGRYKFNSFRRKNFSLATTIWSTRIRTFMTTSVITTMPNEAIFASHRSNRTYAIEPSAFSTRTQLAEMLRLDLCPSSLFCVLARK